MNCSGEAVLASSQDPHLIRHSVGCHTHMPCSSRLAMAEGGAHLHTISMPNCLHYVSKPCIVFETAAHAFLMSSLTAELLCSCVHNLCSCSRPVCASCLSASELSECQLLISSGATYVLAVPSAIATNSLVWPVSRSSVSPAQFVHGSQHQQKTYVCQHEVHHGKHRSAAVQLC